MNMLSSEDSAFSRCKVKKTFAKKERTTFGSTNHSLQMTSSDKKFEFAKPSGVVKDFNKAHIENLPCYKKSTMVAMDNNSVLSGSMKNGLSFSCCQKKLGPIEHLVSEDKRNKTSSSSSLFVQPSNNNNNNNESYAATTTNFPTTTMLIPLTRFGKTEHRNTDYITQPDTKSAFYASENNRFFGQMTSMQKEEKQKKAMSYELKLERRRVNEARVAHTYEEERKAMVLLGENRALNCAAQKLRYFERLSAIESQRDKSPKMEKSPQKIP